MKRAVVVDCVRTPIGRAHAEKGVYRDVRADDLLVPLLQALVQRTGLDPERIDDVIIGCTQQQGEQGLNLARAASLVAGLASRSGGTTVNRLCGSSLQALHQATHAIMAGFEDVQIVGGVEHMHHYPMDKDLDPNPKLFHRTSRGALNMGITAEYLAQQYGISRRQQDEFALRSHQRAAQAHAQGDFRRELIPIWGRNEHGQRLLIETDQCVRPESSLEALASLRPAFLPGVGTITAGNSSPLNDGASAMLVMSEERAEQLGLRPLVRIVSTAVAGVDPAVMGTGPVPATRLALERAGLTLADIDLVELNEAFAAQVLTCCSLLELDQERLNVRGGAIAIGHPLGASGTRLATTLIHAMLARGARYGLATMCIGLGQGIATVFQRVEA